jgi:hypothetical protein
MDSINIKEKETIIIKHNKTKRILEINRLITDYIQLTRGNQQRILKALIT